LVRYIDLSEVHENVIADDVFSVVIGEEWSTVRGDAGDNVGVIEAHETKGRGETFLVIRLAGVGMSRCIVGNALGDGGRVIEGGMIRRVTEFRGGSRITVVNGVVAVVPKVTEV